tara:strand:+ start:197 stop:814 length:618 start_codon:yes stop_codon:yes gene_type:complete
MSTTIYHTHHIIPRHAGGTNHPDNLVRLTTEEHAEAHRLLYEEYGRWEDKLAWLGLSGRIGKEEIIRQKSSNTHKGRKHSEETKLKMSKSQTGRKHSEETKCKISISQKGIKKSDEAKQNMSNARKGTKASAETKLKMSNTRKGKSIHPNGRVFNDEWKQNISNSLKDRTFTDEWKQKISKACKLSHKSGKRKPQNRNPLTGKFC